MTGRSKGGAKAPPTAEQVKRRFCEIQRDWPIGDQAVGRIVGILSRLNGPEAWREFRAQQVSHVAGALKAARDAARLARDLTEVLAGISEEWPSAEDLASSRLPLDQFVTAGRDLLPSLRQLEALGKAASRDVEPWQMVAMMIWREVCLAWLEGAWTEGTSPPTPRSGLGRHQESPAVLVTEQLLALAGQSKSAASVSLAARGAPFDPEFEFEDMMNRREQARQAAARFANEGMRKGIAVVETERKNAGRDKE